MIVSCEKCTKKFNIRDDLIPEKGRLLQCGNCNHKWFYKLPIENLNIENENSKNLSNDNTKNLSNEDTFAEEKKKIIEKVIKSSIPTKKPEKKINNKADKNTKKGSNLLKRLIVLIISIVALIILIDTFKFQIENYIPGVSSVLNNLYETLKDLSLFVKDLIN